MTDPAPPWLEVTPDAYQRRMSDGQKAADIGGRHYIAMLAAIHDLIRRQERGEVRLRLVLREAHDLAGRNDEIRSRQNPYLVSAYAVGDDAILLCAAEVVIEMADGTRYPVPMGRDEPGSRWANGVRGGLKPGRWTTHPLATRYNNMPELYPKG